MTDPKQSTPPLLSAQEQAVCQKIAAQHPDVAGQRAATLLAINGGATQTEAAAQTGLTAGQIRYLLTAFRQKRLAIFPNELLSPAQPVAKADNKSVVIEGEEQQAPAKIKKEKKKKKSKKDKKVKAGKLGKKTKKTKGKGKKAGKKKSKK
jgi:hypothetical protein